MEIFPGPSLALMSLSKLHLHFFQIQVGPTWESHPFHYWLLYRHGKQYLLYCERNGGEEDV